MANRIEGFEYDKTASIEPFSLIYEVKKYQELYNKQMPEFANTTAKEKEKIWEKINNALFPNYIELNEEIKDIIKVTVRKRWKSLRDALVKDHRLRAENPEYREKKMSATVKQMQFLVPYIQYSRYDQNFFRHRKLVVFQICAQAFTKRKRTESFDGQHSPDFCKLMNDTTIDLTFQDETEYSHIEIDNDEMVTNAVLYPSVHLTTPESGCERKQWRNRFFIPSSDAYNGSNMQFAIREIDEFEVDEYEIANNASNFQKLYPEEELHLKLTQLIKKCNEEHHDEDRMFLLSLLSDFKRVPLHKKLKVKSAFITALNESLD